MESLIRHTKLLLHGDGTDASTFVPDSAGEVGTVLMLHFDGANLATTTPDAATNKAITFNGGAVISTVASKFGGSSLLCVTLGYVNTPTGTDFAFGTGDYTVNGWFNFVVHTGDPYLFAINDATFRLYFETTAPVGNRLCYSDASGDYYFAFTPTNGIWYHIELTRASGSVRLFVDGTQIGNTETSNANINASGTYGLALGTYQIGGTSNFFSGYVDDFAVIKGKALHTANFTAPTVSPSPKDVTCVGNAQIDTAQKVFGTGSILFGAGTDWLNITNSADFVYGTNDFTMDGWVRFSAINAHQAILSTAATDDVMIMYYGGATLSWAFRTTAGDVTYYFADADIAINTWYHIAVTRNGTNLRFFRDGVQKGVTETDNTNITAQEDIHIGNNSSGSADLIGWIDELRISKGIARWTSNFTPPTKAYAWNEFMRSSEVSLPTVDNDLNVHFTDAEAAAISSIDGNYILQSSIDQYAIFLLRSSLNTQTKFSVTWRGKSDRATTDSTAYLQIYNRNSSTWETLASNNGTAANTDFTMSGHITTNLSYYYDSYGFISCRVYQQAI